MPHHKAAAVARTEAWMAAAEADAAAGDGVSARGVLTAFGLLVLLFGCENEAFALSTRQQVNNNKRNFTETTPK